MGHPAAKRRPEFSLTVREIAGLEFHRDFFLNPGAIGLGGPSFFRPRKKLRFLKRIDRQTVPLMQCNRNGMRKIEGV